MELGELIDSLYELRSMRLELTKQVEDMQARESQLRAEIIQELKTKQLSGWKGQIATASIQIKVKPLPVDWPVIYDYIYENKMFELLQKRLSVTLWKEMQDAGVIVPGVETCEFDDLSLTKSKRN